MSDSTLTKLPASGGSGSGLTQVYSETPSGAIDGANAAFSLIHAPASGTLRLYLNGARQKATDDYALTGANITLTTAPPAGSNLLADYAY